MRVAYAAKNFASLIAYLKQDCLSLDQYSYTLGGRFGLFFFVESRKSGHLQRSLQYTVEGKGKILLRGGSAEGSRRSRFRTLKTKLPGEKKKSWPESKRANGTAGA